MPISSSAPKPQRRRRAPATSARQVGVRDDVCRDWFIRKLRARDRRAAKALIAEHAAAVDAWLATRDQPYEGEAAAFFWLREAGEEL